MDLLFATIGILPPVLMVIAWPLLRRQLEIPMTHWSMGEQIRYRLSVCLKISPPRLKCFRKWLSDNGAPGYKSTRKPKSVYGTSKREFFYSQKSMPRLVIGPNKSKDGGGNNVRLEDCFIGILEIVDDAKARLTLDRCYVGKLSLYNKALEDLESKTARCFQLVLLFRLTQARIHFAVEFRSSELIFPGGSRKSTTRVDVKVRCMSSGTYALFSPRRTTPSQPVCSTAPSLPSSGKVIPALQNLRARSTS